MTGRVFRICGCRDESGRQLGARCPRIGAKNHGSWAYQVDLGKDVDGKRKQKKKAGFRTKGEALDKLGEAIGDLKAGRRIDDKITVGKQLDSWLAEKTTTSGISSAGRSIRPATEAVYKLHIEEYLKPHLGQMLLVDLTADDISKAYRKILAASAEKIADHDRLQAARDEVSARRGLPRTALPPVRVAGITTIRRVHAALRAALNAAVRSRKLAYNPALGVELPAEQKAEVIPWKAAELGKFLDHIGGHRLAALFEVLAACGLRRGEALGLMWSDLNVERGELTIRRQLLNSWANGAPVFGEPKTANGRRVVELASTTVGSLMAHQMQQDLERTGWGTAYEDHDLIFCQENGRPLDPAKVTKFVWPVGGLCWPAACQVA
jgi:integrase